MQLKYHPEFNQYDITTALNSQTGVFFKENDNIIKDD